MVKKLEQKEKVNHIEDKLGFNFKINVTKP